MHAKLLQSCLTLCNPVDCSPPGSSVHEILQVKILDWVAMPSSRESSQPRDWTHVSYVSCIGRQVLYHQSHLGSPERGSVQFSCSVVSDSLWPYGLKHARLTCLSPTPGACPNSCPLSRWYHPTISSFVVPFSSCPQSFPATGSFLIVSSSH